MSPSLNHEKINGALRSLVLALADHLGVDCLDAGSTTFRREDLQRGFEPDSSFYFQKAALMRTVDDIDLGTHPAPELVIEIDVTRSSINKDELYHAIGVGEVWRWTKNRLIILERDSQGFREQAFSRIFPQAGSQTLTDLVFQSAERSRIEWNRMIGQWLQAPG